MPSNRDTQAQDPTEDDDLIGAGEDAEEADEDDEEEDEDDDILDEEDDDEDDEDDADDEDDDEDVEEDEEGGQSAGARDVTTEVGSEGGSPGEAVERVSRRAGLGRGSEATETWEGGRDRTRERRDDDDVLVKRAP